MEKEINKKEWDYTRKAHELGTHANALISLHLKKPAEFDKAWLFDKLIAQYEELGLDADNKAFDLEEEE